MRPGRAGSGVSDPVPSGGIPCATPLSAAVRRGVPALVIAFAALSAVLPAAAATKVLGDLPRRGWLGVQARAGPDGHPTIASGDSRRQRREGRAEGGRRTPRRERHRHRHTRHDRGHAGSHACGRDGEARVRREEEEVDKNVKLVAMPFEKSDEFDILYDVVDTEGARLRLAWW